MRFEYEIGEDYWEFEVDWRDVARAFVDLYGGKNNTMEEKCVNVIEKIADDEDKKEKLETYNVTTIADAVKAEIEDLKKYNETTTHGKIEITAYNIIEMMLDTTYYEDFYRDELKEYFYDEAVQDYMDNN